jgi:dihydrofolate reductase
VLWGSATLTSVLLEQGLVDEVVLIVYPVLVGTGKRFFAQGTPARSLELASSKAMPSGIVLNAYKVAAPLKAA